MAHMMMRVQLGLFKLLTLLPLLLALFEMGIPRFVLEIYHGLAQLGIGHEAVRRLIFRAAMRALVLFRFCNIEIFNSGKYPPSAI